MSGWKARIREENGNCCKICGRKYYLTVHHKVPKARSGANSKENCVIWCKFCHNDYNSKYGLRTSDDYGNPIDNKNYSTRTRKKNKRKRRR